jgi:hypothetical protein
MIGQISEHSVWDLLGEAARDHSRAHLIGRDLNPGQLPSKSSAEHFDLLALRDGLRTRKNMGAPAVCRIDES